MRIGVISDTHGYVDPQLATVFQDVDTIVHAGDIGSIGVLTALAHIAPVVAVRGNVDRSPELLELPERVEIERGGIELQIVHQVAEAMPGPATRAVVSGHSHRAGWRWQENIMYLNPGAAGRQGFHRLRTVAVLTIDGSLECCVVTLGPKGCRWESEQQERQLTGEDGAGSEASGAELPRVTIYTTSWCPDCRASKRFLNLHGVPYAEFDIEDDPAKAEVVVRLNHGLRRVPTIVIEGGPILAEPSDRELGQALGIA